MINESVKNCILLSIYHNEQATKADLQELIIAQSCENELKYLVEQGLIYKTADEQETYKITEGGRFYASKIDADYHSDYLKITNADVMLYTAYCNQYFAIKQREGNIRQALYQARRDLERARRDLDTERERTTELSVILAEERAKHEKTYKERVEAQKALKELTESVEFIAYMLKVNAYSAQTNAEKLGVMNFISSALSQICGKLGYNGGIPF